MIGIIDYGLGNVRAFANVYKHLNMPHKFVKHAGDLSGCTRIILPGVGAFDYAMQCLENSGLRGELSELVLDKAVPVLGICVGMQMLARASEEGTSPGLGWIDGVVKKFDVAALPKGTFLPHMGWNEAVPVQPSPLFHGLDERASFYFLHSFYFDCSDGNNVIATTDYGGRFSSAVSAGNIFGVQFHPEKSHNCGIQLLKNFGGM